MAKKPYTTAMACKDCGAGALGGPMRGDNPKDSPKKEAAERKAGTKT